MSNMRVSLVLDMVDRITAPVRRLGSVIRQFAKVAGDQFRNLAKSVTDFGQAVTLKVTAPIIALGGFMIKKSADFEQFRSSLVTATGSVKEAQEAYQTIVSFTAATPFQLEEVMTAFIKLKNLGLDPSEKALTSYGNTASAMGKSLDQMIEAVADATTGEFERLKEFGIKTSVHGKKVTFLFGGIKTTIRNDSASIQKYLRDLGDIKFAGGMERQALTFKGVFSNLIDAMTMTASRVGDVIIRTTQLKERMNALGDFIKKLGDGFLSLSPSIQEFAVWAAIGASVLGPLIIGFGQFMMALHYSVLGVMTIGKGIMILATFMRATLIPAIVSSIRAIIALNAAMWANPVGATIAGIVAFAGAVYLIYKYWEPIKAWWAGLWDKMMVPVQAMKAALAGIANTRIGQRLGLNGLSSAAPVSATGSPVTVRPPLKTELKSTIDTGGTLKIQIDQTGQARVTKAAPNDPRQSYDVDTGLIMGGAM